MLWAQALGMINRYQRAQRGISYPMQGLHCGDEVTVPIRILEEDDLVHRFYTELENEKAKQDRK